MSVRIFPTVSSCFLDLDSEFQNLSRDGVYLSG